MLQKEDFFAWASSFSPDVYQDKDAIVFADKLKVHFLSIAYHHRFEGEIAEKEIVLWEDVWCYRQEQVKARIESLVGRNKKISARDTQIISLDKPSLDAFLEANHLMGTVSAKHKWGLMYKGMTVAVASFSAARKYYRGEEIFNSIELVRFASLKGVNVVGGLGKLLEHCITTLQPDDIMTYTDREWSAGEVYERFGFEKVEITPPLTFWVHPQQMVRYQVHALPKTLLNEQKESGLILDNFLIVKGYCQIFNLGNNKFLWKLKQ